MRYFQDVANATGKDKSIQNLFRFFCNNLYLGQWQLAKGSLVRLHTKGEAGGIPISEVLKDVASYPFSRR